MIKIDVRSDIERTIRATQAMERNVPTAAMRALNRGMNKAATEANREIRKVYNLKLRAIAAAIKKVSANRNRLVAALDLAGVRIPLIEFDARWHRGQKTGATVHIRRDEGRKTIPGAFIAKGQVFKRVGKARMPLRALRGTSVPVAFMARPVREAVDRHGVAAFLAELERQLILLSGAR